MAMRLHGFASRATVARRPEVNLLAVRFGNTVQQAETKIARTEVRLKARFLGRPVATEYPDIGVVGIVAPSTTEPVIGGVQHGVGSGQSRAAVSTKRSTVALATLRPLRLKW